MRVNNRNSPSLSASQLWLLAAVGFSSLMVASQTSALNAILPVVARSFSADLAVVQWVVLAYLITSSGLLLAFGRLGDLIGQRRLFLAGFAVFIAGSLLSSVAPSVAWLIATRTIQAVGGGMLTSAGAPLITKSLPQSHRGRALSVQIVVVYFGLAAGPALGGFLADSVGWRWVFLANVPAGIIAAAITILAITSDERISSKQTFDVSGAVAFMVALTSLFLFLGTGKQGPWLSAGHEIFPAIFLLSTGVFLARELRCAEPMLDLRLFKSRFFSAAIASAAINYIGYSALAFLVPFYLVDGMGYGATHAGLLITAMPLAMMVVAPFSGWVSDKVGPRLPASLGMALLSAGIFMLGWLGVSPSVGEIVMRLLVGGMGLGLFSSANNSAIMGAVPFERQGIANGLVSTARQVGMMVGVAACAALFRARFSLYGALGDARATTAAVQDTFLAIAGIVVIGVLTSLVRGATENPGELLRSCADGSRRS
jgi:EmrB/QacA subfamily drug resistance transporter